MSAAPAPGAAAVRLWGRSFLSPVLDYLLIGGGLSLLWFGVLAVRPGIAPTIDSGALAAALLLANSAHFAASTVRLYTKPGATAELPGLSLLFPVISLALLTLCIFRPEDLGYNLQALYLSWSPYHYAAQAYGLSVMYSYRSGCQLDPGDKRLLRICCLLPFFFAFITGVGAGVDWLLPQSVTAVPAVANTLDMTGRVLRPSIFLAPLLLYARLWRRRSGPMPLISLLVVLANGYWFAVAPFYQAFVWATVFHGIQYLAIVMIFHVRDQVALPGNRHGTRYHALWFYAACLGLAYPLFHLLPLAYVWAGFGRVESMLLVIAAINLHHFVVDGYIWRLSRGGSNRRIVDDALPSAA